MTYFYVKNGIKSWRNFGVIYVQNNVKACKQMYPLKDKKRLLYQGKTTFYNARLKRRISPHNPKVVSSSLTPATK